MPYYRIAHVLDSRQGWAGQSEMLGEALLDAGHGVTSVRPAEMPWLFADGALKPGALIPFLSRSRPQLVITSDGLTLSEEDAAVANEIGAVVLAVADDGSVRRLGMGDPLFQLQPSVNEGYRTTELANFVAHPPCVLVLDNRTPAREASLMQVQAATSALGVDVPFVCLGRGWEEPRFVSREAALAYASRSAVAVLLLEDETPDDGVSAGLAVPCADGVPLVALGRVPDLPFADARVMVRCATPEEAAQALAAAFSALPQGTEWKPSIRRPSALKVPSLDEQVEALLALLRERGLLGMGFDRPAAFACLCGYYGTGNFGDEMILEHLTRRTVEQCGLAVVTAVGAVPHEVWRMHGIEAMGPAEHGRLMRSLARSSVLAITAGLLFDQGMRWTCGPGAVAGPLFATDLPGLANVAAIARMQGVSVLFYGTGDGPLELEASRRSVEVAAALGARFFPRNVQSASFLRACRVPEAAVFEASDTLYSVNDPGPELAHAWAQRQGVALERTVIVALRDWPGLPDGWDVSVAEALDGLARAGSTIVFVDFESIDHRVHEAVRAHMSEPSVDYGAIEDRLEVLSLLSAARAGFAMRLHCALVLGRFGKPSIGIAYLPKVAALFDQLGMSDLLVPLSFSGEALMEAAHRLESDYDALAADVTERARCEREKLAVAERAFDEALCAQKTLPERRFWIDAQSSEERDQMHLRALEQEVAEANAALAEARARAERAEVRVAELEGSTTWKVGSALTALPRALKDRRR